MFFEFPLILRPSERQEEEEKSVQSGEFTLKEKEKEKNKTNEINCCATNNSVTHLLEHVQHLNR